jgi:hypothetical protein
MNLSNFSPAAGKNAFAIFVMFHYYITLHKFILRFLLLKNNNLLKFTIIYIFQLISVIPIKNYWQYRTRWSTLSIRDENPPFSFYLSLSCWWSVGFGNKRNPSQANYSFASLNYLQFQSQPSTHNFTSRFLPFPV